MKLQSQKTHGLSVTDSNSEVPDKITGLWNLPVIDGLKIRKTIT